MSVTSPSASTLDVVWSSTTDATSYILDLSVVNSTTVAPVVLMPTRFETHRLVQGLRPGHIYEVTLKALQYYTVLCTDAVETITGKGSSIKSNQVNTTGEFCLLNNVDFLILHSHSTCHISDHLFQSYFKYFNKV